MEGAAAQPCAFRPQRELNSSPVHAELVEALPFFLKLHAAARRAGRCFDKLSMSGLGDAPFMQASIGAANSPLAGAVHREGPERAGLD